MNHWRDALRKSPLSLSVVRVLDWGLAERVPPNRQFMESSAHDIAGSLLFLTAFNIRMKRYQFQIQAHGGRRPPLQFQRPEAAVAAICDRRLRAPASFAQHKFFGI